MYPIVGGRNTKHLLANIEALGVELTQDEIDEIEDAEPFDIGFPLSLLFCYGGVTYRSRATASDSPLVRHYTNMESVGHVKVSVDLALRCKYSEGKSTDTDCSRSNPDRERGIRGYEGATEHAVDRVK